MPNTSPQILNALNFEELISAHFLGEKNAIVWQRHLTGNFAEIVSKIEGEENIIVINEEDLNALQLSEAGQIAREIILNDLKLLRDFGAAPVLNLIRYYERDKAFPFFPTDVYSFHVDRSPIPTSTFLCTYYGASSEILPNGQAEQKINIPEIRQELKKIYDGKEEDFDSFLREHFFDLHYQAKPNAQPISLGIGNLWRLAVDHPESKCLPCIHRAPIENKDEPRLLLIC
jgi:hypothetical protein